MIDAKQNEASEISAKYEQKAWKEHISKYDYNTFKDPELRRRFQMLSILGSAALNESRLAHVRIIVLPKLFSDKQYKRSTTFSLKIITTKFI